MDATYLDHNSSSPLLEPLSAELLELARRASGNPASLHKAGRDAKRLITQSRESIAAYLGCGVDELVFTSGASEGNSWILSSAARVATEQGRRPRLIVSAIEHDSIRLAAESLSQTAGAELAILPVDRSGQIQLSRLEELLNDAGGWSLLSVCHANNETGVIQPVEQIARLAQMHGVPLHLDCAQSLARVPINLNALGTDYASFSAHKIGGPKGTGFVYARKGARLAPLVHGKQQGALRGGTENTLGVALLGRAIELNRRAPVSFPVQLGEWQKRFEHELKSAVSGTIIHGEQAPRLHNTTYVGFEGFADDGILMKLDLEGICASSGAACSSGSLSPSHVLLAMGCDETVARTSVRFSSGHSTSWKDYERVLDVLPRLIERTRARK